MHCEQKKYQLDLVVVSNERLTERHVLLRLTHSCPLPEMLPGQFVEVRIDDTPDVMLRRPISIHHVDGANNELWLLVATVGKGTQWMGTLSKGDTVNAILPLGNGFDIDNSGQRPLLVGGGVGVAPLYDLGFRLKSHGVEPTFLLGARVQADLLQLSLFQQLGQTLVTTEDGSMGERGFVTQHSVLQAEHFTHIYTCGPKPMMVSVARYAQELQIPCEASLENMMACGLGACLCCVEKTTEGNLCVCKDGPVFNTNLLLW